MIWIKNPGLEKPNRGINSCCKIYYNDDPTFILKLTKIFITPKLPDAVSERIIEGPIEKALNAQLSAIFWTIKLITYCAFLCGLLVIASNWKSKVLPANDNSLKSNPKWNSFYIWRRERRDSDWSNGWLSNKRKQKKDIKKRRGKEGLIYQMKKKR